MGRIRLQEVGFVCYRARQIQDHPGVIGGGPVTDLPDGDGDGRRRPFLFRRLSFVPVSEDDRQFVQPFPGHGTHVAGRKFDVQLQKLHVRLGKILTVFVKDLPDPVLPVVRHPVFWIFVRQLTVQPDRLVQVGGTPGIPVKRRVEAGRAVERPSCRVASGIPVDDPPVGPDTRHPVVAIFSLGRGGHQ